MIRQWQSELSELIECCRMNGDADMKPNKWDFPNLENIMRVKDHFMDSAKKFENAYNAAHRLHERLRAEGIHYILIGGIWRTISTSSIGCL